MVATFFAVHAVSLLVQTGGLGGPEMRTQTADTGRDVISLRAVTFLKSSPAARLWDSAFAKATANEVIARLRPTSAISVAARVRSGVDSMAFRPVGREGACGLSDATAELTCALAQARYYADVGEPVIRNDSAFVVVSLYSKAAEQLRAAKVLVIVVRQRDGQWQARNAILARE